MKQFTFYFMSLLVVSNLSFSSLYSQTKPTVEKKYFQRADGKIYWQEKLPVFLQISGNSDLKNPLQMKEVTTEKMKNTSNPFYWDGHGIHHIKHDDYGESIEHTVHFVVHVDGIAPITRLNFVSTPTFFAQGVQYYGKNLKGSLRSTDELSGIDKVYASLNGVNYSEYTSEISFGKEGENIFKYYAVDSTGNEEKEHEKIFTVDLTAPVTTHTFEKDYTNTILSPRTLVKLAATDNIVGVRKIYYKIDDLPKRVYAQFISLANLSDGNHKLTFFSVDHVKNEETFKVVDFYLDRTEPIVSSKFSGNFHEVKGRVYLAGDATISLTATDNKAGVKEISYSISNGKTIVYDKPFILSNIRGAYNVKARGIDNINNRGVLKTPLSDNNENLKNVYLDNVAPKVSYSYIGKKFYTRDTMFITSTSKLKLKSVDNESGTAEIKYVLDGSPEQKYEDSFSVKTEGLHTIKYTGFDNVKNSSNDNFFFIIDNTGPKIFYHMSLAQIGTQKLIDKTEEIPIYASNTRIYLAATDKLVGTKTIFYSFNGKPERLYNTPIKLSERGSYKLKIRSVDELGNITISPEYHFVIQ